MYPKRVSAATHSDSCHAPQLICEDPPPNRVPDAQRDNSDAPQFFVAMEDGTYHPITVPGGEVPPFVWYEGRFRLVEVAETPPATETLHNLRRDGPNLPGRRRCKKPYTKQYARRASHPIPLDRDPFRLEQVDQLANPRGLIPTVDWFRLHPHAEFRLTRHGKHGPKWFVYTFYAPEPVFARGVGLLGWQLRNLLAEPEFKVGTPLERLTRVFRFLKRQGYFRDPFRE